VRDALSVDGARSGISGIQFNNQECISETLKDPVTVRVLYGLQDVKNHLKITQLTACLDKTEFSFSFTY
jgi:hypothetical protein